MSIPSTFFSLLKTVLERRMKAYAETAAEDAALWARNLQRRLLGAAVALTGVLMSLFLAGAWIVGTVWNTPWPNPVLAALLGTFVVCAIIGVALAVRPPRPGHGPFTRLRRQLGADMTLLCALCAPGGSQQTRTATAPGNLMQGDSGSGAGGSFPRSTMMRVLFGISGLARIFQ